VAWKPCIDRQGKQPLCFVNFVHWFCPLNYSICLGLLWGCSVLFYSTSLQSKSLHFRTCRPVVGGYSGQCMRWSSLRSRRKRGRGKEARTRQQNGRSRSPSPSPFTPATQASGEATFKHVTFPGWTSQRCKTQNSSATSVRKLASVKFVWKQYKECRNKQNFRPPKLVTDSYLIHLINCLSQLSAAPY